MTKYCNYLSKPATVPLHEAYAWRNLENVEPKNLLHKT